jgi:hypothetical protein
VKILARIHDSSNPAASYAQCCKAGTNRIWDRTWSGSRSSLTVDRGPCGSHRGESDCHIGRSSAVGGRSSSHFEWYRDTCQILVLLLAVENYIDNLAVLESVWEARLRAEVREVTRWLTKVCELMNVLTIDKRGCFQ